jgi:sodium-coupled neutral amino acid transporter 2
VSKTSTYSGVVRDAFGGIGRFVLLLCIIFNNMGMLIAYMVIIGIFILFIYNMLIIILW